VLDEPEEERREERKAEEEIIESGAHGCGERGCEGAVEGGKERIQWVESGGRSTAPTVGFIAERERDRGRSWGVGGEAGYGGAE
jgi:hypothetical protein